MKATRKEPGANPERTKPGHDRQTGAHLPKLNKKVPSTKHRVGGFLGFGERDRFPQDFIESAQNSDVAGACLDVRHQYITGNGWKDVTFSRLRANNADRDNFDQLLSKIGHNVNYFEAIVLHVGYNALGQIASLRHVPLEKFRLCKPDDTGNITHGGIFPYLGSTLLKGKENVHTKLPLFNPDRETVLEQIDEAGGITQYTGQLFYSFMFQTGDEYYHVPSHYRTPVNMETDAELGLYDWRLVSSGFASAGVFGVLGKRRSENRDTVRDENSLQNQISNSMGADDAGNVIVYEAESADELEALKFHSFSGNDLATRYDSTVDRVGMRICRQFRVPAKLADIHVGSSSIFASDEELKNLSRLMQSNINRHQRFIQDTFRAILPYWKGGELTGQDLTIENFNYFRDDESITNAG